MPDLYDEAKLREYAEETVRLANSYLIARREFGKALVYLKIELVKAYKNKTIKDTISEEKAYLQLIALNPEVQDIYEEMIMQEQEYKGLEKVIDARRQNTSQEQSLIKNRIQEGA